MKKYLFLMNLVTLGLVQVHAQTPYDHFAPEQNVKPVLSGQEVIIRIYNKSLGDKIAYMEYNSAEYSVSYFSCENVLLQKFILDLTDFKWLSMDPANKEYPEMSPYNFAGNNPISFKDPDGGKIVIYYKDENGKSQSYEYGSALKVPNNMFVQETIASIERGIMVNKENEQFINDFKNDPLELSVIETTNMGGTNFIGTRQGITDNMKVSEIFDKELYKNEITSATLFFNPNSGLKTFQYEFENDGSLKGRIPTGRQSPSNFFWHEIDHFKAFFLTPKQYYNNKTLGHPIWTNKEEYRVITGSERQYSEYYSEGISNSHIAYPSDNYMTTGATTITPCATCDVNLNGGTEVELKK